MITNLPTAEQLDESAKTAFFAGWVDLMRMISDFENYSQMSIAHQTAERAEYYRHCCAEIDKIYFWASQSNELALKAMIVKVSPYLLLLGVDNKLKGSVKDIDFTELRTLDAVDLLAVVSTATERQLAPEFRELFTAFRTRRNKIAHQGKADDRDDPLTLVALMARQYGTLWPDHRFLRDWFTYLSGTRHSYFHDGKWSTPHMQLYEILSPFFNHVRDGHMKALTGISRKTRRYCCLKCYSDGSLDRMGALETEFRTAYLSDNSHLSCLLCEEAFEVSRIKCSSHSCKGNVIATGDWEGACHLCGSYG